MKPPSGLRLAGNVQSGYDIAYENDILLLILLPRAAQIRDILVWSRGLANRQYGGRPLAKWGFSNTVWCTFHCGHLMETLWKSSAGSQGKRSSNIWGTTFHVVLKKIQELIMLTSESRLWGTMKYMSQSKNTWNSPLIPPGQNPGLSPCARMLTCTCACVCMYVHMHTRSKPRGLQMITKGAGLCVLWRDGFSS